MSRRSLRPGVLAGHLLVLIAALVCLRLGWWQWNVTHESRGTIQNLGYAILWPVFGGAFIFMWLRFLYLEDEGRVSRSGAGGPDLDGAADLDGGPDLDGAADFDGAARRGDPEPDPSATAQQPAEPDRQPAEPDRQPAESDREPAEPDRQPAQPDREPAEPDLGQKPPRPRRAGRPNAPTTAEILAVATVGDDDEDDPELAAYNAALARLAEQDQRRAR